jgi:hypothetical protein
MKRFRDCILAFSCLTLIATFSGFGLSSASAAKAAKGAKAEKANIIYTHPQTGILFPSEIDPLLTFSGLDNYEEKEKGLGVGLRYDNSKLGIKANIYLYNQGKKNIPDGTLSSIVKEAYKDSISEMYGMEKKGYYKNVKKLNNGIVSFRNNSFHRSKYSYKDLVLPENKRVNVVSYTYVTGYKGYILKIRFTYINDSPEDGEPFHDIFMKSILKII